MIKKIIKIALILLILFGILFQAISPILAQANEELKPDSKEIIKIKSIFYANIKPVENYLFKINLGLNKFPSSVKTECKSYKLVEKRMSVINNIIIGSKEVVNNLSSTSEVKNEFEVIRQTWNDNRGSLYTDYLDLSKCAYNIYISEINDYLEYAGYMSRYIDSVGGNGESVRNEIEIVKGELASSQKYYSNNNFWSGLKELGRVKDNIKNIQVILTTYK